MSHMLVPYVFGGQDLQTWLREQLLIMLVPLFQFLCWCWSGLSFCRCLLKSNDRLPANCLTGRGNGLNDHWFREKQSWPSPRLRRLCLQPLSLAFKRVYFRSGSFLSCHSYWTCVSDCRAELLCFTVSVSANYQTGCFHLCFHPRYRVSLLLSEKVCLDGDRNTWSDTSLFDVCVC